MRRFALLLLPALACVLPQPSLGYVNPSQVIDALGIPSSDIVSVQMQLGTDPMLDSTAGLGTISATDAPAGLLYTGQVDQMTSCSDFDMGGTGENGDTVQIRVDLETPPGMHSFKFNFYFLSREYPQWVGSEYNDSFTVTQNSSIYNGNIVFDQGGNVIDVNTALFTVTNPALLVGTGFDCAAGGGGTGWLTTVSPAVPGESFALIFAIGDVFDGIWDSAVFLDGFQWREEEEKEPHPAEPIGLRFLSPKVGPTEGGQTTVVYGTDFTTDCSVEFDGAQASQVTLLSSERLQVVTPAHGEGMVNVRVWSQDSDESLQNGYTYTDEDAGTLPPELVEVLPAVGPLTGEIPVVVRGGNFQDGTMIFFDGAETNCNLNGAGTEFACTLPPYAGEEEMAIVLIEAENPSGAEAMPPLTFTYSENAPTGDGGGSGNQCDCNLGGQGAKSTGALALILLLAWTVRRNRREV